MAIYNDDGGVLPPSEWTSKVTTPDPRQMTKAEYDEAVEESFGRCVPRAFKEAVECSCGSCSDFGCDGDYALLKTYSNPLMDSMACTFARVLTICGAKNADYAGDGDPFKNFRASELVGVDPARAILVRITDKIARIGNLIDNDPAVAEESILDACDDLTAYGAILRAWLEMLNRNH